MIDMNEKGEQYTNDWWPDESGDADPKNEFYAESITLDDDQDFHEEFGYLAYSIDENDLFEAEYQGRKVKLNKPMRGDVKKFKVYVKDPKTGNVKKVNFGHGGTSAKRKTMRIRKSNPAARRSFRARHNCDNPGPKTKARYWSCRKWQMKLTDINEWVCGKCNCEPCRCDSVVEKWSSKYKKSIDCSNPKGFSQKAHCAGKKKKANENFADGKKPGRKGLAKRMGVDCSKSKTALRKIAKNSTGEKRRMAHFCANMKKQFMKDRKQPMRASDFENKMTPEQMVDEFYRLQKEYCRIRDKKDRTQ